MDIKNKSTVILVTTYFPPINSVACNRTFAFAKYLNKNIFDVHVITIDAELPLIEDIPGVKVHRLKNPLLFKKFTFYKKTSVLIRRSKSLYNKILSRLFIKEYRGWEKLAYNKCIELINSGNNVVILSSYAPVEAHLVPLKLKINGFKFKWIADFRDEMSSNPYNLKNWKNKFQVFEQDILNNIDALTSVSSALADNFRNLSKKKNLLTQEIRNGFDFNLTTSNQIVKNKIFTVIYIGTIRSSINLDCFYTAIGNVYEKNNISDFVIKLVGVGQSFSIPNNLQNIIIRTDQISHDKAIDEMFNGDALLFILPKIGRKGVYTGKLFEYLGSRKPIIAITDPDDVAAELIRNCNAGFIANIDNAEEVEDAFMKAYNLWKNNERMVLNDSLIDEHHHKNQVAKIETLILKLINE